jgi:hypothetical protein
VADIQDGQKPVAQNPTSDREQGIKALDAPSGSRPMHVAGETGGEAHFVSFGPLPSLGQFLGDIADHLANQYPLEFLANPGVDSSVSPGASPSVNQSEGRGTLLPVTVPSKSPDLELMVPSKAWIPRHEHTGTAGAEH